MCHLINNNAHGPFLVVCPLSVLSNWIKEFEKFAPLVPVLMYHGTPTERAELRETKMREELLNLPLAKKKAIPGGTGRLPVFPVVRCYGHLRPGRLALRVRSRADLYDV